MHRSPLESLHRAAGARFDSDPAAGQVLSYVRVGDEYRAGRQGCAVIDATRRGSLEVRGADAGAFLHRLLAGEVRSLEPDQGCRNLLLSPKGKVIEEFELRRAPHSGYQASTHPGRAAELAQRLERFLFDDRVELVDTTDEHAPLDLLGPSAAPLLETLLGASGEVQPRRTRRLDWNGVELALTALPVLGQGGWRLEVDPAAVPSLWRSLLEAGAVPLGHEAAESLRVENGAALFGVDVDDTVYPQEAHWEDAFSLSKGCFVGQEVVAKIDTYGGLKRGLVGLRVEGEGGLGAGVALLDGEDRAVGRVTSCAFSPRLASLLALGYVKLEWAAPGTLLKLEAEGGHDGRVARVVPLPID